MGLLIYLVYNVFLILCVNVDNYYMRKNFNIDRSLFLVAISLFQYSPVGVSCKRFFSKFLKICHVKVPHK